MATNPNLPADGCGDDPQPETQQEQQQPRRLAGLVAGRIVLFVLASLEERPFLIINPGDGTGTVNGVLFFDGPNDSGVLPIGVQTRDNYGIGKATSLRQDVAFDDSMVPAPFTWHWPAQAIGGGPRTTSIIDPDMLRTIILAELPAILAAELPKIISMEQIENYVRSALSLQTDTVNALLDEHTKTVQLAAGSPVQDTQQKKTGVAGESFADFASMAKPTGDVTSDTTVTGVTDSAGPTGLATS